MLVFVTFIRIALIDFCSLPSHTSYRTILPLVSGRLEIGLEREDAEADADPYQEDVAHDHKKLLEVSVGQGKSNVPR